MESDMARSLVVGARGVKLWGLESPDFHESIPVSPGGGGSAGAVDDGGGDFGGADAIGEVNPDGVALADDGFAGGGFLLERLEGGFEWERFREVEEDAGGVVYTFMRKWCV